MLAWILNLGFAGSGESVPILLTIEVEAEDLSVSVLSEDVSLRLLSDTPFAVVNEDTTLEVMSS